MMYYSHKDIMHTLSTDTLSLDISYQITKQYNIITEQIIVAMITTVILTGSNQTNKVPLVFTPLSNSRTL